MPMMACCAAVVFGCADPPSGGGNVWFTRSKSNPSEAEMGCGSTSEKWRVTCVDSQWTGTPINCSHRMITHALLVLTAIVAGGKGNLP